MIEWICCLLWRFCSPLDSCALAGSGSLVTDTRHFIAWPRRQASAIAYSTSGATICCIMPIILLTRVRRMNERMRFRKARIRIRMKTRMRMRIKLTLSESRSLKAFSNFSFFLVLFSLQIHY